VNLKRSILLGMLALALPGAGCSTFSSYLDLTRGGAEQHAARQPSLPNGAQSSEAEIAVFLAQAKEARAAGDLNTAAKLLGQLVLIAPDDPHVIGDYGKVLTAQGRSDDALAFLERSLQLQPGDWTLYSAQGVAFDQEGKYLSAQASYARALELKPGEAAVLNNNALSHMQAGDLAGAENLLRQVSPQSPDYVRVTKTLALLQSLKPAPTAVAARENRMPEPVVMPAPAAMAIAGPEIALMMQEPAPLILREPAALPVPAEQPKASADQPAVLISKTALTPYEALKADPTVMMAPLPVDDTPRNVPQPLPAKPPVTPPPPPPAAHAADQPRASHGAKLYVQAGAYLSDARARQAATGLEAMDVKIMQATVNGREMFRLRIGPFSTMAEAKEAFADAQALGRSDLFITPE
jgi:Flp pilus assembly protein TadD